MDLNKIVTCIPKNRILQKEDFVQIVNTLDVNVSESSIYWLIRKMIENGFIMRVGRNQYRLLYDDMERKRYDYRPSKLLNALIDKLSDEYPLMEFQTWEAIQLNYFVNHQIAHNTLFVEVESMLEESVFEFLRAEYGGNVLLRPNPELFGLYAMENTIVISNLITEAPVNKTNRHLVTSEKLLVDLMCNKIISMLVEKSEYPVIMEEMFMKYVIDESCLFRYARRRNAEARFREYLRQNTHVKLMTEGKHAE